MQTITFHQDPGANQSFQIVIAAGGQIADLSPVTGVKFRIDETTYLDAELSNRSSSSITATYTFTDDQFPTPVKYKMGVYLVIESDEDAMVQLDEVFTLAFKKWTATIAE